MMLPFLYGPKTSITSSVLILINYTYIFVKFRKMILIHKLLKAKAHQIANSSAFLLTVKWQQTQNHDKHMCTNEEGLSSHRLGGGGEESKRPSSFPTTPKVRPRSPTDSAITPHHCPIKAGCRVKVKHFL